MLDPNSTTTSGGVNADTSATANCPMKTEMATSYSTTNTADHSAGPPRNRPPTRITPSINNDTSQTANCGFYVRLKGLPWGVSKQQLIQFFSEKSVVDAADINILFLPNGRASGEALVGLKTQEGLDYALNSLNNKYIESRYIEVHKESPETWTRVFGRVDKKHNVPISQNSHVILMRGLPFSAHEDDCLEFFKPIPCLGVHLTKGPDERPSGQGYAEFENKSDFDSALQLHKKEMQNRYIELFESTINELVENVKGKRRTYNSGAPRYQFHQTGWTTVTTNTGAPPACLKMRGLPYSTTEEDITVFFQRENVTPTRIHRKQDGAEAFVEFSNPADANLAMKLDKAFMGKRYVELFRVDYEEMAEKVGITGSQPPRQQYGAYGMQRGGGFRGRGAPRGAYGGGYGARGGAYGGGYGMRGRGRGAPQRYNPYTNTGGAYGAGGGW